MDDRAHARGVIGERETYFRSKILEREQGIGLAVRGHVERVQAEHIRRVAAQDRDQSLLMDAVGDEVADPEAVLRGVEGVNDVLHRHTLVPGPLFPVVKDQAAARGLLLAAATTEGQKCKPTSSERTDRNAAGDVAAREFKAYLPEASWPPLRSSGSARESEGCSDGGRHGPCRRTPSEPPPSPC